ncbi:hypothetical protein [Brevibacillus laterosporus]|uniref:hypothetical protein n=1 Tax=Brevibacillus laterosporus TaxID=1465 RepID=UPI000E6B5279|nr:hypothetical protein [Brevibacillus laterosporus]AYB37666.1 hypothetical protein D5F52_04855 [Brevibacillus laterosporus]MBM7111574.1 hypothetical protein [Brevibacillus laterosporus]
MRIKIGLKDGTAIYTETLKEGMAFLKPMDEKDWLVKKALVPYRNIEYIKLIADKNEVTIHKNGDVTLKGDNIKFDKEISASNLTESIEK